MRALPPKPYTAAPADAGTLVQQPAAARQLWEPLLNLAENSDWLVAGSVGEVGGGREPFRIPRFIFMGPRGGGDTIRLGIFAAIHGDEPEGAEAVVAFLQELESAPELARGYHIHAYPLCNPTGFAARTRTNASGQDLAGQFWRGSTQPEVYYLEREMGVHHFQGVISLHCENNPGSFSASTRSSILNAALVQPAVDATRKFIPGVLPAQGNHTDSPAESFPAASPGFLTATDELNPAPFEINLRMPRRAPKPSQIHGTVAALKSILGSYRALLALRQNI
ncbi:MAG: peptidase [Pedosphaera sp.]|nr:peptidase [Pedosphaera sp.]